MLGLSKFAALGLALLSVGANAESAVTVAVRERDIIKLESLRQSVTNDEVRLATGAALALRHKDEAAAAVLKPLSLSAQNGDVRAGACFALSDIALRQTHYAETRDALACVEKNSGRPLTGEPRQILEDMKVLSAEEPMRVLRAAAGKLAVLRDTAGLLRVPVTINGKSKRAVIDSDASFSVLSQSAAELLGVRVFDTPLHILTSSRPDQIMHLGIADRFEFGDAVLTNVLFAVLPDKAMQFDQGYKMDVVVGLPVLVALHRIALVNGEDGECLMYGSLETGAAAPEENLLLSGLDPFVMVRANGGMRLRLAVDTAASKTVLNATALRDFPQLHEGASKTWAQWRGAGGASSDTGAFRRDDLTFAVAGHPVGIKHIEILSEEEADRHGALGLDVLKKGTQWVLDFDAMSLFFIE